MPINRFTCAACMTLLSLLLTLPAVAAPTLALTISRLDEDHLDDVAVAHDDKVVVYTRDASSKLVARDLPTVPQDGVLQIIAEDLDDDCRTDLVLVRPGGTQVLRGLGDSKWEHSATVIGGTNGAAADFDDDGLLDLVIGGNPAGAFVLLQCSGDGREPGCGATP